MVALGEKEVQVRRVARNHVVVPRSLADHCRWQQIWFQNRRQNDRRKSKPLEPHELVAPRASTSASTINGNGEDGDTDASKSVGVNQKEVSESGNGAAHATSLQASTDETAPAHRDDDDDRQSQATLSDNEETEPHGNSVNPSGLAGRSNVESGARKRRFSSVDNQNPHPRSFVTQSPPSLRISMSSDGEALVRKQDETTPSPPKGRGAVRISMSTDGQAVIRTEDEPSPSKNRIRSIYPERRGLQRSASAAVLDASRLGSSLIDRDGNAQKPFGRSRDARTWKLYCDTDARSALSTPLSSQSSGSTIAAGHGRRSLSRTLSKSSNLSVRPEMMPFSTKRQKLSRTMSSLGRLETTAKSITSNALSNKLQSVGKATKGDPADIDWDVGDSDKENWVPGTRQSIRRRHRRATSQIQRKVLADAGSVNRNGVDELALAAEVSRERMTSNTSTENTQSQTKLDAEVAAFMSGAVSREEDLNCIQGLLSLSQGAWR